MENNIDKLTKLGTDAVQSAISQYMVWEITSSVVWLVFGFVLAIAAIVLWSKRKQLAEDHDVEVWATTGAVSFIVFLIAIILTQNIPDLVAPRAKAIHSLLQDARGH